MKLSTRHLINTVALATTVGATLMIFRSFTVIPSGSVGVVDEFGKVSKVTLKSGATWVNPLVQVVKLSTRTQERKETLDAPSQEGLSMMLDVSILYHLNPDNAPQVYQTIGTNYEEIILIPQLRSVVREITASYSAKSLYSSQRQKISQQIREQLSQRLVPRGIILEDVLLRKLELPQKIQEAVQEKLQAEQQSLQMEFVLQKERQEVERKRIEAQGIADFQRIISQGLNDKLLQLKRIEMAEKVAQSNNAKVVIVSAGDRETPITLQP